MRLKKPASGTDGANKEPRKKINAAQTRELLSDVLAVGGAMTVAVGIGMIYLPAGVIAGGLGAVLFGWLIARGGGEV